MQAGFCSSEGLMGQMVQGRYKVMLVQCMSRKCVLFCRCFVKGIFIKENMNIHFWSWKMFF